MTRLNILERVETLDHILSGNLSCARFGDGELMLMCGMSIRFQKRDRALKKELSEVLNANSNGLIVCIPHQLVTLDELKPGSRKWYFKQLLWTKPLWMCCIKDKKRQFGDSFLSRPWMSFLDREKATASFDRIKRLWYGRAIVIVEGEKTRFGCNNDLLDGAKSVERILGPSKNAYDKIDDIYAEALKMDKSKLFILALGPTATVLANRLFKAGYQACDLGHLDVEYEWFRLGSEGKVAIPGKYVNEAGGDKSFMDAESLGDYESQIVARIT